MSQVSLDFRSELQLYVHYGEQLVQGKTVTHQLSWHNDEKENKIEVDQCVKDIEQVQIKNEINQNKPQNVAELQSSLKLSLEKNLQLQLTTNQAYEKFYCQEIEKQMLDGEFDLCKPNPKVQISQNIRGQMANWMIEVFAHYIETSSSWTYFRAMAIFDSYLCITNKVITDYDVHLIGLASILIASKLEDRESITLKELHEEAAHKKYTMFFIINNQLIMQTPNKKLRSCYSFRPLILNNISNSTKISSKASLQSINSRCGTTRRHQKIFYLSSQNVFTLQRVFGIQAIVIGIDCINFCSKSHFKRTIRIADFYQKQSNGISYWVKSARIKGILQSCFFQFDHEKFVKCYGKIKEVVETWDVKYENYKNLKKYAHYEQEFQLFNDCQ